MTTNNEKWMNYDILRKNDENIFKKENKNISKKKLFSCEMLPLTWGAISMLQYSLAEYQYNWYFYSCEIFKIFIFLFSQTNVEFNVLKRLSFSSKPTNQSYVKGFDIIPVTDCVKGLLFIHVSLFNKNMGDPKFKK